MGTDGEPQPAEPTAITIAVVIPSRNDAQLLAVCLAHLAAQTRPADEIIVVDNASSDDTAAVCAAAGVRRIYWAAPGVGGASAVGFDAARAGILARLDADSRPGPDWLARVEAGLGEAGDFALVTGPGDFYGGTALVRWAGRVLYLGGYFHVVGPMLGHPPVFGSNYAMTAAVWERIGPAVARDEPRIHDDLDVSYLVRPDMSVRVDPAMRMPVSARPFESWGALGLRLGKAWTTLAHEFRRERPWNRRRERKQWERSHRP
ncbi:glycosyltransferase family 2 protein [Microterricola pindariensis]|uniref:4,4'-diaponeurosporenoate glycosyltransferase n=1 Tax=Microterricola pindariensis TaxID=478010 RepID=A0ABX5AYJ2_9MICO|nr:glycosyltransferase family 2 protein [Microterricola pindariensis]PPL19429.1 glycosyl transferase [Microterricola pindariensis]